jgi:hypothetical protein
MHFAKSFLHFDKKMTNIWGLGIRCLGLRLLEADFFEEPCA